MSADPSSAPPRRVPDPRLPVRAGRLLRAAMVAVSKGGPSVRPASNEN